MKTNNIGDKIFNVFNVIFFGMFALVCIYPIYYILINSISDNSLVMKGAVRILPRGIHFENYINIFHLPGIGQAAMISVARTVIGTILMLISSSVLGYCFSKEEYWHRKFWYRFVIVTMYFSAGLIPVYLNMKRLGLFNTFAVYVVGSLVAPFNMILVKTYIESISECLEESAVIDGAGYFQRFTKIILPLSKPILATITIFTMVGQWNSYVDTIMYTSGTKLQTLQSVLHQYLTKTGQLAQMMQSGSQISQEMVKNVSSRSVQYTITAVTILPILIVYPFFQRYFIKGIMIGAVKG